MDQAGMEQVKSRVRDLITRICQDVELYRLLAGNGDISLETLTTDNGGRTVMWTELCITPDGLVTKQWFAAPIEDDDTHVLSISLDRALERFDPAKIVSKLELGIHQTIKGQQAVVDMAIEQWDGAKPKLEALLA